MKTNKRKQQEKGQIIVILAISLVALLALTALAIDGGQVYNQRRTDQSTADSAALAGAGAAAQALKNSTPWSFYCGSALGASASTAAAYAAADSATDDGVELQINDFSTGNGVQVTCGSDDFATYLDVHVMVTSTVNTTFAKVIGQDTLGTKVEATARVYPKQPAAFGNALVSLAENCSDGMIEFGGNFDIDITKGGIFSNSCLWTHGTPLVRIYGGTATYRDSGKPFDCPDNISSDVTGFECPILTTQKMPKINIPVPECSDAPYVNAPPAGTINPGNYTGLQPTNSGDKLILNPGLYCIKGDVDGKGVLIGNKVTLYFITGTFDSNANAQVILTAPDCETSACGVPPAIRGVLMYFADTNYADVIINGNADNEFLGTIYGLNVDFTINGNSETDAIDAQIIGRDLYLTGSGKMSMDLSNAAYYQQPASIELLR